MAAAAASSVEAGAAAAGKLTPHAALARGCDPGPYLVFGGKTGWIGEKMVEMLRAHGATATAAEARLENREEVAREIDAAKPKFVLNCAGLTGRPNVDWCEDHKDEVVRVNVIGTLSLLDLCESRGIHCTNFATGCIYKYDAEHPVGGKGFTEEDAPNFTGSFYSLTKGMVERLSREYKHVLTLRFRMPISDDLHHRNFITKITKYAKVVNIPNSMTVLYDMLPVAALMINRGLTGVYNFTNPDPISHNQILDRYIAHIDSTFWYDNFSEEECNAILKAQRSNNTLDTTKLVSALPDVYVPPIHTAIEGVFIRMAENLKAEGRFPPENFKGPRAA